jgi:hypothetical protein
MATALHVDLVRFDGRRLQASKHACRNRRGRRNGERETANGGSGKKKRPQHWIISSRSCCRSSGDWTDNRMIEEKT